MGSYSQLVLIMRTAGNKFNSVDHVEGVASDEAYIKSNVQLYFNRHLGVQDEYRWLKSS